MFAEFLKPAWKKHRDTILFNKNLLIADTCSLFLSALFAQVVYSSLDESNVFDSILTAMVEYCIDTPIFLLLYFYDHRRNNIHETKTQQTKHLLGVFSACDIMYVIIKIFIQFQFLANLGVQPYQAALISSLIAWVIFLFLINLTMHATRIFSKNELIWYYCLILAISVANSLIFFSGINLRAIFDNAILDVSAAAAVAVSVLVVVKQVLMIDGTISPKTKPVFLCIFIGITLWCIAEVTWTYYQLGLGIANPFPSVADAWWLAGYPFIGFAMWKIFWNHLQAGKRLTDRLGPKGETILVMIMVVVAMIIVVVTYIGITVATNAKSPLLFGEQEFKEFYIALAYPLFDSILLIPVVTIIWSLRRIDPLHTHWVLLCSFVILSTIGDIGFAYAELINPDQAEATVWVWDTFFNSGYICLAASLLWYYKFTMPMYATLKDEEKELE